MEQLIKLQNVEGDSNQGISNLNNKTQAMVNELKGNITSKYAQEESKREKMEQRIVQIITKYADENKRRQVQYILDHFPDSMTFVIIRL